MLETVDATRQSILGARYMHRDETDEEQVWQRVAETWATTGQEINEFYDMMREHRALPNTPAIANAGRRDGYQMGSACFVLPIEDSVASIMDTMRNAALVQKSGGGTGFDFSELRREGATISSTNRTTKGPVHFLKMYSDVGHYIDQGGLRDQANMGILRCDHPDVLKFIHAKRDSDKAITNFNISVAVTDNFMADVDNSGRIKWGEYHPEQQVIWDAIIDNAWKNGDPGLWFVDTTNKARLHPELYTATNPCGEVPLLPYEACVLGSVNLAAHIQHEGGVSLDAAGLVMQWDELEDTVRTLVRMLDNVVELQDYPLPIIKATHHRYRKIGVGVMGYADALVMLGVCYGSSEALALAEEWMAFIQRISYDESFQLAEEKGAYGGYYVSYNQDVGLPFRRNLCCQVIAPTGSIARLAGCSFGIEPNFAGEYDSYVVGQVFHERHPLRDHPEFVTTYDVSPEDHVRTAVAFQKYVDQGVSKTVNMAHDATRDDVERVYRLAYELGMKGVTVFRDDCKESQVIKRADACVDGKCAL